MDELDRATEQEELARADAIRARRPAGPQPTGHCHFCDEPVADGLRWCDAECRDGWERRTR